MTRPARPKPFAGTLLATTVGLALFALAVPAPASALGLDGPVNANLSHGSTRIADCYVDGSYGPCYEVRAYAHPIAVDITPGIYQAQAYIKEAGTGSSNYCSFVSPLQLSCEDPDTNHGSNALRVMHPLAIWCVSTHAVLTDSVRGVVAQQDGASGCFGP